MVAPFVLGQHAWSVVRGTQPGDWKALKKAIKDRFSLPRKALVDAFYALDVAPGWSLSLFVMSVEDKHARLNINKENCYCTHAPK